MGNEKRTSVSSLFPLRSRPRSRERLDEYLEEVPLAAAARKSQAVSGEEAEASAEASALLAAAGALRAVAAAVEAASALPLLPGAAAVEAAGTHREAPREAAAGAASRGSESTSRRARFSERGEVTLCLLDWLFFLLFFPSLSWLSSPTLSLRRKIAPFFSLFRKKIRQPRQRPRLASPAVSTPATQPHGPFQPRRRVGEGAFGRGAAL